MLTNYLLVRSASAGFIFAALFAEPETAIIVRTIITISFTITEPGERT